MKKQSEVKKMHKSTIFQILKKSVTLLELIFLK